MNKYLSLFLALPLAVGGFFQIDAGQVAVQAPQVTVIAIDSAIAASEDKRRSVDSIATLLSLQSDSALTAALFFDGEAGAAVAVSANELRAYIADELESRQEDDYSGGSDLTRAVAAAGDYLDTIKAPAGSGLLVLTPGIIEDGSDALMARQVERFVANGWRVDIAGQFEITPHESFALVEQTGGAVFPQITPAFIDGLLERTLAASRADAPTIHNQTVASVGLDAELNFQTPPRTDSIRIVVYSQYGYDDSAFQLIFPSGRRAPLHDLKVSENIIVYESPLNQMPEEGVWRLSVSSAQHNVVSGLITISNPVQATLLNRHFPVGAESLLEARTTVNGAPVHLDGIAVSAGVAQDGERLTTYQLMDDGAAGDRVANDGIYSAILPVFETAKPVDVRLGLSWPSSQITIESVITDLPALEVPIVSVNRYDSLRLTTFGDWNLAELAIEFNGEPYFVAAEDLQVVFTGAETEFVGRVAPLNRRNGLHSKFAVWGMPPASDDYTLTASLTAPFGEFDAISSRLGAAAERLAVGNLPPSFNARPNWLNGAPIWSPVLTIAILLAAALTAIKLWRRPRPFGFLYDENGEQVVNFAAFKRSWWRKALRPSSIGAAEIFGERLASNIAIVFRNGQIGVAYKPDKALGALRINGKPCPLSGKAVLDEGAWLGFGGKLLQVRHRRIPSIPRIGYDLTAHSV